MGGRERGGKRIGLKTRSQKRAKSKDRGRERSETAARKRQRERKSEVLVERVAPIEGRGRRSGRGAR
jgi:hypothetical protein